MPFATTAKLGAGSTLFYENTEATPAYVALENALNFGQVGEQGEFVQITPISKTVHEYIRGMTTPPSKQFTFNHVPGDADYQAFLDLVDDPAVDSINMRVEYSTGDQADFTIVPNGRVMDEPQGNGQLQMIVFSQQTGSTDWSELV